MKASGQDGNLQGGEQKAELNPGLKREQGCLCSPKHPALSLFMRLFQSERLFAICWHSMKSSAPFDSFFLGFLLEPGGQKNAVLLETGREDGFCVAIFSLQSAPSDSLFILLQDSNNKGLTQRRVAQQEKGCSRSGLLP